MTETPRKSALQALSQMQIDVKYLVAKSKKDDELSYAVSWATSNYMPERHFNKVTWAVLSQHLADYPFWLNICKQTGKSIIFTETPGV